MLLQYGCLTGCAAPVIQGLWDIAALFYMVHTNRTQGAAAAVLPIRNEDSAHRWAFYNRPRAGRKTATAPHRGQPHVLYDASLQHGIPKLCLRTNLHFTEIIGTLCPAV